MIYEVKEKRTEIIFNRHIEICALLADEVDVSLYVLTEEEKGNYRDNLKVIIGGFWKSAVYFGVEDTGQPIPELIEEIRLSNGFKQAVKENGTVKNKVTSWFFDLCSSVGVSSPRSYEKIVDFIVEHMRKNSQEATYVHIGNAYKEYLEKSRVCENETVNN